MPADLTMKDPVQRFRLQDLETYPHAKRSRRQKSNMSSFAYSINEVMKGTENPYIERVTSSPSKKQKKPML